MEPDRPTLLDCDHVVMTDGRIFRVIGNLESPNRFVGYNVYSPTPDGDRERGTRRYCKNFLEDTRLPDDVLDTYEVLDRADVAEHHDPVTAAPRVHATLGKTVWADLYAALVALVGDESVGIFGSALLGMHLNSDGAIRKDVDYVIHGDLTTTVPKLATELPEIRRRFGFTTITPERHDAQHRRYRQLFRNPRNTLHAIIGRRWAGLQLSPQVASTIRFRDPAHVLPLEVMTTRTDDLTDDMITGQVTHAECTASFPASFTVATRTGQVEVYVCWWKFATPVQQGDIISACGSILPSQGQRCIIRLTHFRRHWLTIHDTTSGEHL